MKKTAIPILSKSRTHKGNSKAPLACMNYLQEFRTVSEIALMAGFQHDCDNRIKPILKETGLRTGADRVIVFEMVDSAVISATHEWCNNGIPRQINTLQDIAGNSLPSLLPGLEKEGRLITTSIEKLPYDLSLFFETRGVRSAALYPLKLNDKFTGFISFEGCSREIKWNTSQTELMMTISGMVSKCFDCRLYEKTLRSEKDSAVRMNRSSSEFIARMSHEIRTSLNAMIGMSEALFYKVDSDDKRKLAKSTVSSGKLLLSLLNDILELSRAESDKLKITRERVDMNSFLEDIEVHYHDVAARKNLSLYFEKSIHLPETLLIDGRKIKQVLFNLLSNAIMFTRWGHIKLSADFIVTGSVSGQLKFTVSDTGPGIAEERLSAIFDVYTQFEDPEFYEEGITGLGLAIAKEVTEKMGGTIEVESVQGKGSVFTVKLPAEIAEPDRSKEDSLLSDFDNIEFSDSAILIIDDDVSGIEMIENHISDTGIRIFSALNLETALEKLKRNRIDLIIMDLYMPIISGDEMVKMIRTKPELKNIPCISYTAAPADDEQLRKFESFDDHLFKPVTRANLFSVLTRHLRHERRPENTKTSRNL